MITQTKLKERLNYNYDTGIFTWISADKRKPYLVGRIAGVQHHTGYCVTKIGGKMYPLHRLAFLYVEGIMPKEVDHINHIRNDNRWLNLRICTHTENQKNQKIPKNNTSGFIGVYWNHNANKWHSRITVSGKKIHLGYFKDKNNAINSRIEANKKYGFHENHGLDAGRLSL